MIGMDDGQHMGNAVAGKEGSNGARQNRLACDQTVLLGLSIAVGARTLAFSGCDNYDGCGFWTLGI